MSHKIEKLASCTCGCHLIKFEKWTDDDDAFMQVYENSFYSKQDSKTSAYLKRLWSAIRGKEYLLYKIVLSHEDTIGLRNALIEVADSPSDTQTGAAVYISESTKREDGDNVLHPEINREQSLCDDYPADSEIVIVETQREIIWAQHRDGNWYNLFGAIVTDKVKHWWKLPEEMRNERACY